MNLPTRPVSVENTEPAQAPTRTQIAAPENQVTRASATPKYPSWLFTKQAGYPSTNEIRPGIHAFWVGSATAVPDRFTGDGRAALLGEDPQMTRQRSQRTRSGLNR
jgi:hypothetical protein